MFPNDQAGHVGFRCAKEGLEGRAKTLVTRVPERFDSFVNSLDVQLNRAAEETCNDNPVLRQVLKAYLFYYYFRETGSITGFRGQTWFSLLREPEVTSLAKSADVLAKAKRELGYVAKLLLVYHDRIRKDPEWQSKFYFLDYYHHVRDGRSQIFGPDTYGANHEALDDIADRYNIDTGEDNNIRWSRTIYHDLGFPKSPNRCLSHNVNYWNKQAITDAELGSVDTFLSLEHWLYSFWFRRYREETTNLVHTFLKLIAQDPPSGLDSLISNEGPENNEEGYEEAYEEVDEGHEEIDQEPAEMPNCDSQFNLGVSPQALSEFHFTLLQHLRNGDREAVIKMVNFPLRTPKRDNLKVNTPDDLRKHYDSIFTDKIVATIAGQIPTQFFCNYQGAMYGSGGLWFNNFNDAKRLRIVTVNN